MSNLMSLFMYYEKLCEQCGKQFTAHKSTTRFCSKYCADAAYKEKLRRMNQSLFLAVSDGAGEKKETRVARDIMSPRLVAEYLGVDVRTVYRYFERGLIPSVRLGGRTLVRRADVDRLFDNAPAYRKRMRDGEGKCGKNKSASSSEDVSLYTTVKEVSEKYGLSPAGADKVLKNSGITLIKHKGKNFYYFSEVEALFRKREAESHPEITEWYTSAQIQEKYGLKESSIWDIVSRHGIPRKRVHNVTYYSKIHFDAARGIKEPDTNEWYTVQDAMERYGQSRDQVYNVLRYNGIQRLKQGRTVKFRRQDYDEVMKFAVGH